MLIYIVYNNHLKVTKHVLNARNKYSGFSGISLNKRDKISVYLRTIFEIVN